MFNVMGDHFTLNLSRCLSFSSSFNMILDVYAPLIIGFELVGKLQICLFVIWVKLLLINLENGDLLRLGHMIMKQVCSCALKDPNWFHICLHQIHSHYLQDALPISFALYVISKIIEFDFACVCVHIYTGVCVLARFRIRIRVGVCIPTRVFVCARVHIRVRSCSCIRMCVRVRVRDLYLRLQSYSCLYYNS